MKRVIVALLFMLLAINAFCQLKFENKLAAGFKPEAINNLSEQRNPGIDFINYSAFEFQEKQEFSYEYYEKLYYKSKSNRNMGILMTAFGTGLMTISYFIIANSSSNYGAKNSATLTLIAGGAVVDIGIFLWIYNGIKGSNNKKAMERVGKKL